MKHMQLITRKPSLAQDIRTPLQVKVDFKVDLVDRSITYMFQKEGGAL